MLCQLSLFSISFILVLKLGQCEDLYDSVGSTDTFIQQRELRIIAPPVMTERSRGAVTNGYIQQLKDHSNPSSGNWQQLYYSNDQFFQYGLDKSAPVFFMLGGEGPMDPIWAEYGNMFNYAEEYGAYIFLLEHRFYGRSQPTDDWSTSNLQQYLTTDQALADAANFVDVMKNKFNLQNNKWIAFGGSYSGCLSAWMRLKYPDKIAGAVSTSAPVEAKANFFEYYQSVDASLDENNPGCSAAIKEAVSEMNNLLMQPDGGDKLTQLFNICPPLDQTNDNDVTWVFQSLASMISGVVQFEGQNPAVPGITQICNIMLNSTIGSNMQRYINVRILKYKGSCLDFRYSRYVWDSQNTTIDINLGSRQWLFQSCNEFGYFQTSDATDVFVGSTTRVPGSFWSGICTAVFGDIFTDSSTDDAVGVTNSKYLGRSIVTNNVGNIVFISGSTDPWHPLAVTDSPPVDSYKVFYIKGMSHGQDMLSPIYPNPREPAGLQDARKSIGDTIGQWINS